MIGRLFLLQFVHLLLSFVDLAELRLFLHQHVLLLTARVVARCELVGEMSLHHWRQVLQVESFSIVH